MNFLIPDKEPKLTEAEIMKALECCSKSVGESCHECPLHKADCFKINIEEFALDLINSKNAENEDLQKQLSIFKKLLDKAEAKMEEIRAEAIKEYAERVNETTWYRINQEGKLVMGANSKNDIPLFKAEDICQIAKEMGVE